MFGRCVFELYPFAKAAGQAGECADDISLAGMAFEVSAYVRYSAYARQIDPALSQLPNDNETYRSSICRSSRFIQCSIMRLSDIDK